MSDQRHDDHGPSRPQVIDLEAEEIRTEPEGARAPAEEIRTEEQDAIREAEPPPPPPPPPPPQQQRQRSSRGSAAWIAAALILGAIGGGWLYRDVISSYFPTNEMLALRTRLAAAEANGAGLAQEIAALKQAADAASRAAATAGETAGVAARNADAALSGVSQAGGRIDALDQRIAAAETSLEAASADLAQFRTSLSSGATQSGAGPIDTAALAALAQRIDALEKDVASLESSAAAGGAGDKAAVTSTLSQALSDLKAKVAAGAAYPDEYDRIARMVPAAAGLETVGAHAAEGLPDAQGLTAELRAAIPALPQPAPPVAEDNSYFGTLMKSLSGVITIRAIGETDWPAVAGKAADFAEAGDLNQAIATIDGAEGEKPMALTQWRERAAGRLQLEAALAQVSEAVLRQIAAMGGAQQ